MAALTWLRRGCERSKIAKAENGGVESAAVPLGLVHLFVLCFFLLSWLFFKGLSRKQNCVQSVIDIFKSDL